MLKSTRMNIWNSLNILLQEIVESGDDIDLEEIEWNMESGLEDVFETYRGEHL